MEDDFLSSSVSLLRKGLGIRGEWKDGEGEWKIPVKELLRNFIFSPKVINHKSNLRTMTHLQGRWRGGNKGQLMGNAIENLDFQLKAI
jgi:hypothetical protein